MISMHIYNFDVVFLGGLFPKETEQEIYSNSKGSVDNAANSLQWKVVKGLDCVLDKPVTVINSLFIGSFPKRYKKYMIKNYIFNHSENTTDINVGFLNLPIIKLFFKYTSLFPHLKKWAKTQSNKKKIVIAYSLANNVVESVCYIKNNYPEITTVIIVPDLPQYMNTSINKSFLYTLFKKISMKHIDARLKKIDGFVLLTKYMAETLKIDRKNFVVVEGVADKHITDPDKPIQIDQKNIKKIVYTGTMNEKYGVLNLVNAFKLINNHDYRLVLCGAGDAVSEIQKIAKLDARIDYKGQLQPAEITAIQQSATVLINPRQNNEEFTKYSFPSKNMEYLSSGIPLIAYKLDGIPDEYDRFIFYVTDDSVKTLANRIDEVCNLPEGFRQSFGSDASTWVLKEKSGKAQAMKIMNLISQL